jgi:hypothetical protein
VKLQKPKIVLVITDETERNYSNFLLGEKRIRFPSLSVYSAIDMLLSYTKYFIPLKEVNFKTLEQIMSDEKLRYPKIILDILLFMKGNISRNSKPSFAILKN